jgi:flagellin
MSLRINTNVSALAVQNSMTQSNRDTNRAMKNLATGSRLSDPSTDVAGAAVAEQMKSEIRGMGAAKMNSEAAVGFASVAEGALSEQANILTRMRELAVQSASDNYSSSERVMMNKEYSELKEELDRIARSTRYGAQNILDGSVREFDFQVGTTSSKESRISYTSDSNTTSEALEVSELSVEDKADARDSLDAVDRAMDKVAMSRASFGAMQSRLESAQNNLGVGIEKLSAARSQIADTDLAKEVTNVRRGQILQQYQSSMLQQANDQAGLALKLIG